MNVIRTTITRFRRPTPELNDLTPRMLADAGIELPKARGLMASMMETITPRYAIEMIREK